MLENMLWATYRDNFLVLLGLSQGKDRDVEIHTVLKQHESL